MLWVDINDPCVIATVITGRRIGTADPNLVISPDELSDVESALRTAGDVLMRLSGFRLHPAGVAEEDYIASPTVHRLTPTFRPIREVLDLSMAFDAGAQPFPWSACIVGQDVYFSQSHCDIRYVMNVCNCEPQREVTVQMKYRFGSTITPAARRMLELFAHQLYLDLIGSDECELPQRVNTVTREGLTFSTIDPQTFLTQGFTGLTSVDIFLAAFNPDKARRPSAVYTPDSPPGVARSVRLNPLPVVNPL